MDYPKQLDTTRMLIQRAPGMPSAGVIKCESVGEVPLTEYQTSLPADGWVFLICLH